jgi:hypothetical protein
VSLVASYRLLLTAAAALLIAAAIVSPPAHALLLGDAVVRSEPGAPLRVVIPLKPTPGEALDASCFRLVAAGASTSMVTAKVSLERAAATPRLIVTTQQPVADPLVRFAIDASCDGTLRRNYALKLDPRGVASGTQAITANSAREPGQERLETVPAATVKVADTTPVEPARASGREPQTVPLSANGRERPLTAAAVLGRAASAPLAPEPARGLAAAAGDSGDLIWYVGAALGMAALTLGALLFGRRATPLILPDWTRGGEYTGPRSRTDMSAQPVMLAHEDDSQPMPRLSTTQRPDGASLGVVKSTLAANTLRRQPPYDLSTLDTLINDMSEEDRQEDHAVRQAWAAARSAVESEEDNEILRAIDKAERELLLVPPQSADAAQDRPIEDDTAAQPHRSDKAAA